MPTYILNSPKMFGDVADGIAVIINSETGIYYGLNGLGTQIYENIINGVETDAIIESFAAFSGNNSDTIRHVLEFIEFFLKKEILIPSPRQTVPPSLDWASLDSDNALPEIKEYMDAQEMLLADPIHEVNEETGWAPDKKVKDTDSEAVKRKESKIAW